jgi:rhodanese-related sulfurtransferase
MVKRIDTDDVRRLVDADAQLLEVLPASEYDPEHLPGAHNVPFTSLSPGAVADLDPTRATVVYCYDLECDLSARAAHLLEAFGFTDVYDYGPSKITWFAYGHPAQGTVPDRVRAGAIARDVPRCGLDATVGDLAGAFVSEPRVVVTTDSGVVLGVVRAEAQTLPADTKVFDVLDCAPPSVRPSITADELAESMDKDQRTFVLVTDPEGVLFGVVERDALHGVT